MDKMSKFESYSGFLTRFMAALLVSVTAGCGSVVTDFTSIAVTPTLASISIGGTQQFRAQGTASGSSTTTDITNTVTWTSNATTVATISSSGLATGVSVGSATITATSGSTSSPAATLTVTVGSVSLASAATFGAFGGATGITNQGTSTAVNGNGNIGTTGASTLITGFHDSVGCVYAQTLANTGNVTGKIFTAPPSPAGCPTEGTTATSTTAAQAHADAQTAFDNLSPTLLPGGTDPSAGTGELGGLTLTPGVYQAPAGSFQITTADLVLDALGNPNATWVFQMASTLTVGAAGAPRSVLPKDGALEKNVFWRVGSTATINAAGGGTMMGTIISSGATSFSNPGSAATLTLNGRALALNGSVSIANTVINVPSP